MSHTPLTRRQFLASTAAATAATTLAPPHANADDGKFVGLAASQTYPEQRAALTVPDPSRIRMLQLTDIHFFCEKDDPSRDKQTLEDIPRLIETTQPDVLLVSGDLWHDNPDGQGRAYMEFALEQVQGWGVPWLFTWGNHDRLDDYPAGHDALHDARHSLYRGGASGGNYVVALRDKRGQDVWDLICMNSMHRGLQPVQQEWLKALPQQDHRPRAKHAFCVVHIPVAQYTDIWAEPETGGVFLEDVCSWDEDGTTLPLIDGLGTVRAYFCGHDHVNDYKGTWGGVELNYGRATGHGGYGGDKVPKGAKIITVNAQSGKHTSESILADGSTWNSEPGRKIDSVEALPWA